MFTRSVTIFRLLGFDIKVDLTWVFLAILITWSLAARVFPMQMPGYDPFMYWALAIIGAIGLFGSIIVHEMGHSLVARHYGIPIKEITLFIFGGVANLEGEPERPRDEFFMAIAGPATSGVIAVFLLGVEWVIGFVLPGNPVIDVLRYLALINGVLALFNMVPAFPLDGGRVLRAILWDWKKDIRFATRVSATLGSLFGLFLIMLGVFAFISGDPIGGVWFFLIGLFVRAASSSSYQHMMLKKALSGESVRRFMKTNVVTVVPNTLLRDFVENIVYTHHHKMYPVMYNDQLRGCVTTRGVKAVPAEQWGEVSVGEIAEECGEENTVSPDTDAMDALSLMQRTGRARLLVVEDGQLIGVVALKDLMDFLNLKLDLEAGRV
jgi:Zn-dependent protease/predicted transcriptional regulator